MKTDKILNKIKKLLAMSNDTSSPSEAMIAANLVRKLMDKHQIEEVDLEALDTSDFSEEIYKSGMKSRLKPLSIMGVAVAKFNDCQAHYSGSNILFKGLKEDSTMSVDMLSYLIKTMYSSCKLIGLKGKDGTSYRLGFADGIARQVKELLKERENLKLSNGKSLMVCKNQLVTQEFGGVKYKQGKSSYTNGDAYSWGKAAGKSVNLSKQRSLAEA